MIILISVSSIFPQWENLGEHFTENWTYDFQILNDKLYVVHINGIYSLNVLDEWSPCYTGEYLGDNGSLYNFGDGLLFKHEKGDCFIISDYKGENWTSYDIDGSPFNNSKCLEVCGNNIVLVNDSIEVSSDTGKTWIGKSFQGSISKETSTIYKNDYGVFVGGWGLIYYSGNNGQGWVSVNNSGLPLRSSTHSITSVVDSLMFCSNDYGLYKSINAGQTWEICKEEFSFRTGDIITQLHSDKRHIYGVVGNYIYSFDITEPDMPYTKLYVPSRFPITSIITFQGDLYASSSDGVYRFERGTGIAEDFSKGLEISYTYPIFAVSDSCVLSRYSVIYPRGNYAFIGSDIHGEEWKRLNFEEIEKTSFATSFVPLGSEIYSLVANSRSLFYTYDFGERWFAKSTYLPAEDPEKLLNSNGVLYLRESLEKTGELGETDRLWLSKDKGESWQETNYPYYCGKITNTDSSSIILRFQQRKSTEVYISFDDFKTYEKAPFNLPQHTGPASPFNNSWILGNGKNLYVWNFDETHRSYDWGKNWETSQTETDPIEVNKIDVRSVFADSIMVGTSESSGQFGELKVLYSFDLGKNWRVLNDADGDTMLIDNVVLDCYFYVVGDYFHYVYNGAVHRIHSSYILNQDVPIASNSRIKSYKSLSTKIVNNHLKLSCEIPHAANISAKIFTPQGRKIYQENRALKVGKNDLSIPVANLASGIYLLSLQIGKSTYNQKITIK